MTKTLLQRAQGLARAGAPAFVALAIMPIAEQAHAISSSDLQLQYSGSYWYNASGYYENPSRYIDNSYNIVDQPGPGGSLGAGSNVFGGPKLYGTVAASTADFTGLNYPLDGFRSYYDAGVALVWGGRLTPGVAPEVGDSLAIHFDFTIDLGEVPNATYYNGEYKLSALIATYDLSGSNSISYSTVVSGSMDTPGSLHIVGDGFSNSIYDYEVGASDYYWRIALAANGYSDAGYYDNNVGHYFNVSPGVGLTVPNQSIDVAYAINGVAPSVTDTPEPVSAAMLGAGLVGLAGARRRRAR